jgi:Immunoglobulin domain
MNKKNILQKITIAMFCGSVASAGINAYSTDSVNIVQPEFPKIIFQPEDQLVPFGSNAVFTVKAANADGYQWLRNGNPMDNQTNNSFTITNAGVSDVGFYSCYVYKDMEGVPTRAASLMVYTNSIDPQTGVDPVVVFGFPLSGSGEQGSCPGSYAGYVIYSKTVQQGWGWAPDTSNGNTVFTASDTNRTDTKIQYGGAYGDNGCNQTSVTVPNPPYSPVYRFTIFFTNNVPTNAYPITLDGFKP